MVIILIALDFEKKFSVSIYCKLNFLFKKNITIHRCRARRATPQQASRDCCATAKVSAQLNRPTQYSAIRVQT